MELSIIILEFIQEKNKVELAALFENNYAIDIAIGIQDYEDDDIKNLCNLISTANLALLITKSSDDFQLRILKLIEDKRIIEIFTLMSVDDVADVIGNMPTSMSKNFLSMMKQSDSTEIRTILSYGEDTAGGIMTTQYIALKSNINIAQTLKKIKQIAPRTEVIETLFVTDEHNRLIGTADLRDILIAPEDSMLIDIIDENFIFVNPDTDQEEVSKLVSKYDLKAIPVVNRKHAIIGIVTVDDIIDVMIEEQTEDILKFSGVGKDEKVDSTVMFSISKRLPWLFINLLTAFLASFTVGLFSGVIAQVVALATIMPIIAGMGGNAGTQTFSIVIRSLALGELDLQKDWKIVFKEISVGAFNGLACGIVTGLVIYWKYDNWYLSLIILLAMIANLVIAGFFGFIIPIVLKLLKQDPAVVSSIFLTTATDVFGFFVFLGLATIFLPHLLA